MNIRPRTKIDVIDFKKAPFSFVTNVHRHKRNHYGQEFEVITASTTCCNASVEKNQYGFDEECPCCQKMICWDEEERDKYITSEVEEAQKSFEKEEADINAKLEELLAYLSSKSANFEELAQTIISNIDDYSLDGYKLDGTDVSYSDDNNFETNRVKISFTNENGKVINVSFFDNKIELEETKTWMKRIDDDWDAETDRIKKDVISSNGCKNFIEKCFKNIDKQEYENRLKKSEIKNMQREIRECCSLGNYKRMFDIYEKYGKYLDVVPGPIDILKEIAIRSGNSFYSNYCVFEQNQEGWALKKDNASHIVLEDGTSGTKYKMEIIASGKGILNENLQDNINFMPLNSPPKKEEDYFEKCLSDTFVPSIKEGLSIGEEITEWDSNGDEETYIPIRSTELLLRSIVIDEGNYDLEEELRNNGVLFDEDGECIDKKYKDEVINNIISDCVNNEDLQIRALKDGDSFKIVVKMSEYASDYFDYNSSFGIVQLTETEKEFLGQFIKFDKEKESDRDLEI